MSMTNSSDTIENRIRDIPACSAVPQLTAPPLATRSEERPCNVPFCIAAQDVKLDFGFDLQS
jgi:hypothetical protein